MLGSIFGNHAKPFRFTRFEGVDSQTAAAWRGRNANTPIKTQSGTAPRRPTANELWPPGKEETLKKP